MIEVSNIDSIDIDVDSLMKSMNNGFPIYPGQYEKET